MPPRLFIVSLCVALLGCAGSQPTQPAAVGAAQLVERAKLLGNPTRQFSRISPDGEWVSWLAPHEGVMNLWIAPAASPDKARLLSQEKIDRVTRYVWSPDSLSLIYSRDRGGDQNFVLFSVGLAGGEPRPLTPAQNTRTEVIAVSPLVKDRILIGLNNRDVRWRDLYSLDVRSGDLTLILQNDGYTSFHADPNLVVRAAIKARPDGGSDVHAVESGRIVPSPFETIPYEDVRTTALLGYSADGQTLYWRDSRGRDTAALVAHDLRTGEKKVLGAHPRADVVATTAHPTTGEIDAYEVNPLKSEWTGLTPETRRDLERLARQVDGEIEFNARTAADDKWVVIVKIGGRPSTHYLYDRKSGRLTALGSNQANLEGAVLGDKHAVSIRSRDGLMQAAYLILPPGSDRNGDGRPDAPLPMVLAVHGGPWERSDLSFQSMTAFLASRGYAVLSPNFRGSIGFGKAFISAGDGEWGGKMNDDLVDAAEWAVTEGIAVRDKMAIFGGSYGGYAVLAAMAFTPETFACGVDLFGASNLITQLEATVGSYREFRRAEYYRRVGDPTTEAGRAFLTERSPISRVDAIKRPLLVAQGANDPQVKQAQSDQLVDALRSRAIPVTYLVFPDEGHGFVKPQNNTAFMATTENFLARCLGGRAEPFGESLRASSMLAAHGAEFVDGLAEALAKPSPEKSN